MHLLEAEKETTLICDLCGNDGWRIIIDHTNGLIDCYECLDEDCESRLYNTMKISQENLLGEQ